jgi:hypothetical protein
MRLKIITSFDQHDYQQLLLLAKLNKMKLPELVRRIVQAHLDKGKANLAQERVE